MVNRVFAVNRLHLAAWPDDNRDMGPTFIFRCPCCEAQLQVKERARGQHRRCPGCKSFIELPKAEPDPDMVRTLHFLAREAAIIVRKARGLKGDTAVMLNSFIVHVGEMSLPEIGGKSGDLIAEAVSICEQARTAINGGRDGLRVWNESLASVAYLAEFPHPFREKRFVGMTPWSHGSNSSYS